MSPLFLSVALSMFVADTGRITFRGAVVAPTCSYHHVAGPHVVNAGDCYQGIRPTVAGPITDPATVALMGTSIPTWHLIYR
jgi:type 1 fimbria pilin